MGLFYRELCGDWRISMRVQQVYEGFEQGPIRPPSEAESLLIRISRNCPWNRCTFCPVYKGSRFSMRPVDHVLRDIDTVHGYVEALQEGRVAFKDLSRSLRGKEPGERQALHAAARFIGGGMQSIFLQDGNSLIIKPDDLERILLHLRNAFPKVIRITSYARSHTIARISDADLARLQTAGLNRIHIGLESGSDKVLKLVKKGVDKATQILAGQKVKRAGIELSEYYMPGLGGRKLSREHALESSDALNQINPDYIRLRSLAMPPGAPLSVSYQNGSFDKLGERATAEELLLFLESLAGIHSKVRSDHVLNLFTEVQGTLPNDKEQMIAPVRTFLSLPEEEQLLFMVGRRTHCLGLLTDLDDPQRRGYAEQACKELQATPANVDTVLENIVKKFI